ncbi:DUF4166 domain-containing protein [Kurthia senegalensis]|uniref:DUF4166 domain-containing protein n=1 Tax=Kurthia senegalensis TaxID=1033740 RepID=UPI00028A311B|nr:DUF4166 domain-containing protein [Kurthia senegalensis]
MSVYKQLLGEDFNKLHPMLQHRYDTVPGEAFRAKGIMKTIKHGSPLLFPFYQAAPLMDFLFPEQGTDIPFDMIHSCIDQGEKTYDIEWSRNFYFPEKKRTFNSTTRIDLKTKHAYDLLGKPAMMHSNLLLDVTKEGRLITRTNAQHLFGIIPLPSFFKGKAIVEDGFDDARGVYTVHATVYNDILGTIMMYAGEFQELTT